MTTEEMEEGFNEEDLIGKTVKDASDFVRPYGYVVLMVRKNGAACVGTRDYRTDRIRVAVENDLIVKIEGVG